MTHEKLLPKKESVFPVINTFSGADYPEDPSRSLTLETYLQALSSEAIISGFDEEETKPSLTCEDPRQHLDRYLKKLSALEIPGKEHVEAYLRDQYRRQCKPNTMRNSLIALRGFLEFAGKRGKDCVEKITRDDVEAWIEHEQDRGMKPATVASRLVTVKAFLGFLIEQQVCHWQVISKRMQVKVPASLPRAIDPQHVKRLLAVVDRVRDRAMILIMLRTGMRVGELLNTLVSEVNMKERRIEIFEASKNRVGRVVYLSDDARDALKAWLKERDPRKELLFYGWRGRALSYTAARMMFVRYLNKADLLSKGYSLHCLRHTFATELLNAGMSLPCLQQLLGHSSIEMTLRYARLTDKTREQEYFKAMTIIEGSDNDEPCQLDCQLPPSPKKA
ncbi:MAG: tyrosine-type recombinase/integrase [Deltaproteobacteria bacterium]|nr:tyrosine-type recombinase/integrase [Deltaproteobacteria bacterium]